MAPFAYGAQEASDDTSDTSTSGISRPMSPEVQIAEEETIVQKTAHNGDTTGNGQSVTPAKMDPRAYQLEMLNASLKENVIVAMDTGSGKTQVALLRIQAELDTCPSDKIIWFLAPTVILCSQQYKLLELQLPSVPLKLLTGNENVDSWSGHIWKTIFQDTRIVVSTPDVLYGALCHAFVQMEMLALIVFDEAHHCIAKAPGRRIMLHFYHVCKGTGDVPAILGLSATPSIRGQETGLEDVEQTLDARCVTPTVHREELLKHANRPIIRPVEYYPPMPVTSSSIDSLRKVWHALDIRDDPYVVSLLKDLTPENEAKLRKAISKDNTYCQQQLKGLFNRSMKIAGELGTWASDRYLKRVIEDCLDRVRERDDFFNQWTAEEKQYLGSILAKVKINDESPEVPSDFAEKASLLVRELLAAAGSQDDRPVCVVFARERAMVSMLYELLSAIPSLLNAFRVGAVVGTSQFSGKKSNVYDLLSNVNDTSVLQKFRSGNINLLIATSVLEEGIDVPACNLVICFDEPENFKSFIQRRGRARTQASSLVVFVEDGSSRIISQWQAMEEEMKNQYEAEDRQHQEIMELEAHGDQDGTDLVLRTPTGARIGLDEAKGHLAHFCGKLWRGEFADARPVYITEEDANLITCKVILPVFLPAEVRETESSKAWDTEATAKKDAALQAYVKLYHAGLVNDNLLPLTPQDIPGADVEGREAIVTVEHSFRPWTQVAEDWRADEPRWSYTYTCTDDAGGQVLGDYDVTLPAELSLSPRTITIYKDFGVTWKLQVGSRRLLGKDEHIPDHTSALLASVFGHRWDVLDKPHIIQVCVSSSNIKVSRTGIGARAFNVETDQNQDFLVRDAAGVPFTFTELLPFKPPAESVKSLFEDYELAPEDVPYVVLKKWTRRSDFLHPLGPDLDAPADTKPYGWVLPVGVARVDNLAVKHAQFGMLIPSIIHELEVLLTVKHLTENLLETVAIDTQLVREAISSRAAGEPYDYERLETLGDSILKFCATIHAFSTHPEWPEGYLSFFKDRLVSNARLFREAKEKGLAKYILTKRFTGAKWRPLYLEDVLEGSGTTKEPGNRQLPTKTLADVVEALIGAAYQDGGMDKATECLKVFIDDQDWRLPSENRQRLYDAQPKISRFPTIHPVEELIGYSFNSKSFLLEALTHASYTGAIGSSYMGTTRGRSYERLEFLGDAVLEKIIVSRLFALEPPLRHDKIHTLKSAMVNGDFLAFISLDFGLYRNETTVAVADGEVRTQEVSLPLWKFIRHSFPSMGLAQLEAEERYHELRDEILEALNKGTHYPWALFASLRLHKFFSDVFEAMLGAVWIDSGSFETCEEIISRFGVLKYLDRIIQDGVECQHPKEVLGKCAAEKKIKYEMESFDNASGDGYKEFTCKVFVGDRLITKVGGGVGSEEVKTKAATEAVRIMTTKTDDMDLDLNNE